MRYYAGFFAGIVLTLVVLEIFFRVLPVSSGIRIENSDADHLYSRYVPNQEYVYSHGWALTNHRSGVTNGEGFVNSREFTTQHGLLIFGDSFIEAFMNPYPETMQGQLDQALGGNVLAAASSGNRLPDTLELARHFKNQLSPKVIVIFFKPYELDLLLQPGQHGCSSFEFSGNAFHLTHTPYVESTSKKLILKSALVRYVYYNLRLPEWLGSALSFHHGSNTPITMSVAEKTAVLDYYFTELRKILPDNRIIFLVDGDRDGIYHNSVDEKTLNLRANSALFDQQASNRGFEVIDMQPIFEQYWLSHHERMDFLPMDGHWNPVAHRLAAQAVLEKLNHHL